MHSELDRNALLRVATAAELRWLRDALEPVELRLREPLAEQDEPPQHLYFPVAGALSMVGLTADGRSVELGLIGREGLAGALGIFGHGELPYRVVVQVPGRGYRVPLEHIRRHIECQRALGELLLKSYLPLLNSYLAISAVCNRFHSGTARLSRWLLLTCERAGSRTVPSSHEAIAEMVGGPRSAVSGAIATLRERGFIASARASIQVTDRRGLQAVACECYRLTRRRVRRYLVSLRQPS